MSTHAPYVNTAIRWIQVTRIPAEVYSRVSGYFRPVYINGKSGAWNRGKTEEFKDRKFINVKSDEIMNLGKLQFN